MKILRINLNQLKGIIKMKAIILNSISEDTIHLEVALWYFNQLLHAITTSSTKKEVYAVIKANICLEQMINYFVIESDKNNMTIKQIINGKNKLIVVVNF